MLINPLMFADPQQIKLCRLREMTSQYVIVRHQVNCPVVHQS